jgi:hypothetical protein
MEVQIADLAERMTHAGAWQGSVCHGSTVLPLQPEDPAHGCVRPAASPVDKCTQLFSVPSVLPSAVALST